MNFSKAFDKVSHRKLIYKIDQVIKNFLVKWIFA